MLVITRKENDSIIIITGNECIEITVTEIGKQVRLGISAPMSCKIWRKELYATVLENQQAIADVKTDSIRGVLKNLSATETPEQPKPNTKLK